MRSKKCWFHETTPYPSAHIFSGVSNSAEGRGPIRGITLRPKLVR